MRPGNPALDALRRNVSGRVASGEAVPVVAVPTLEAFLAMSSEERHAFNDAFHAYADRVARST